MNIIHNINRIEINNIMISTEKIDKIPNYHAKTFNKQTAGNLFMLIKASKNTYLQPTSSLMGRAEHAYLEA